jgi:hypothetical protein
MFSFKSTLGKLLKIVVDEVSKKYPDAVLTALGGFIYLRFINPAIINPEYFGIHPSK